MKTNFAVKVVALFATLALATASVGTAYAQDGSDELDECWHPTFTVTSDKASYGANEQITLTATALNNLDDYESAAEHAVESDDDLQVDMQIDIQIPGGYEVVSGSATATVNDVAAGDSTAAQVVIAKSAGKGSSGVSKTSKSAGTTSKTGDPVTLVFAVVCALAAVALLILAACRKRAARDISKRLLSSLLVLTLVAGLSPFATLMAYGDDDADGETTAEADESDDNAGDCDEHDVSGSATFTVDGESVTAYATVAVDFEEEVYGRDAGADNDDPTDGDAEDPLLQATITSVNVAQSDAGYTVTMRVEPSIFSGTGEIDLTKGEVTIADTYVSGGETTPYTGTVAVLNATAFQVVKTFTSAEAQQVTPEGSSVEAALLPLAVYDFTQHKVTIGEGALTNSYGDTMPAASMYSVIGVDLDDVDAAASTATAQAQATTDATANALEDGNETTKISADSLEAGQEMLDAIGEFAEGFEGHSGEFFMGAGSVLGIASKIIEAVDDSKSDLYDMTDVIDRLDTISGDIDKLSAQVSTIDEHLSSIEKKDQYLENIDTVAALVSRANTYQKNLSLYADSLDQKTSTAGIDTSVYSKVANKLPESIRETYKTIRYSYDTLSANDKRMLTQFANVTKSSDATLGKDSVIGLAQDLADYVTAQGAMGLYGASNIYEYYFNYTGTYFNWASETYDVRMAFVGQYNMAFTFAYCTAMNELNVEIATSSDPAVIVADMGLRDDLIVASKQMRDICKSDDVQSCMKARDDGKQLNLVNDKLFSKGFNVCHFSAYHDTYDVRKEWAAGNVDIQFIAKDNSIDSTPLLDSSYSSQLASDISVADFTTMFSNLKAVKQLDGFEDVESLMDEFVKVGLIDANFDARAYGSTNYLGLYWDVYWQGTIVTSKSGTWLDQGTNSSQLKNSSRLQVRNFGSSSSYFYISTNAEPTKIKSKAGWEYIYDYTGTVVDVSAKNADDLVKQDFLLYELDHFKKKGHLSWWMQVNYHPAAVAKAS